MWERNPGVRSLSEIFLRQLDFQRFARNVQPDVRTCARKIKLFKVRFLTINNQDCTSLESFAI